MEVVELHLGLPHLQQVLEQLVHHHLLQLEVHLHHVVDFHVPALLLLFLLGHLLQREVHLHLKLPKSQLVPY